MKTRLLITLLLVSALVVPAAVSYADGQPPVAGAAKKKKKLSYCAAKAKKAKAKAKARVKSAKFFLYTKKRPTEYFFCSESPKFTGKIAAWDGIVKTSHLRAVRNNCAIFYSSEGDGEKSLKRISAKFFRRGSTYPKQTSASTLGEKADTVEMRQIALSSNCVAAAAFIKNGAPTISIAGLGDFPYTGHVQQPAPGASADELKNVKVATTSPTSALVTWTEAGVPKSYEYVAK